jgi:putative transcriptional regulator
MITDHFECRELNTETERTGTAISSGIPKLIANEAIKSAGRDGRDAPPLTESDLKGMKGVPQAKIIRRSLELTQEEFAARYHIPLGTLRDWEQGQSEPDQATRAYLLLIARDPDHVNRVLNQSPDKQPDQNPLTP